MKSPSKTQYFGLPIFYEIKLKNGEVKRARFDSQSNAWITQGTNEKINNQKVVSWNFFGQST